MLQEGPVGRIELAPSQDSTPDDTVRAAPGSAIAEREAADARYQHLEMAEKLVRDVCSAVERVFLSFSDLDATIVEHRAEEFKRVATGGALPTVDLPDDLAARRTVRDAALKQVEAAKAAHANLVAELNQAESTKRQAALNVAAAAYDVLMTECAKEATALGAVWNEIWRRFDRLSALANCRLNYREASFPVTLPSEAVSLLEAMAALDNRDFADGPSDVAANAGDAWCRWYKSLLSDAEAEIAFDRVSS
jgi:hypothetical protein